MSYYIARKIKLTGGKITIEAAVNNVRPLSWFETVYNGSLADLLESISEGNIRPHKNANAKIVRASEGIAIISSLLDRSGLTFSEMFHYDMGDRNLIMRYVCEQYADRIEGKNKLSEEVFGSKLLAEVKNRLATALTNLELRKKQDEENGIIHARSAAYSIFTDSEGKDYTLIFPCEGEEGPILGPSCDYKYGKLHTDPGKIVRLGKEADDLYSFLSFTGVDVTLEDYIVSRRAPEAIAKERFERAAKVVNKVLSAGLKLKPGITPYVGFAA